MNTNTKHVLTIAVVLLMVASAGCAGWGTDGPASDGENNNTNASANTSDDTDELGNVSNETTENTTENTSETGTASTESSEGTSSDSNPEGEEGEDTSTDDDSADKTDNSESVSSQSESDSSDSDSSDSGSSDTDSDSSDSDASSQSDSSSDTESSGSSSDTKSSDSGADSPSTDSDTDTDSDSDSTTDSDASSDSDTTDGDSDSENETEPERTYDFTVIVQESDGAYPLSGVTVTITPETGDPITAQTDDNGEVTADLPEGEYTVSIADYDERFETVEDVSVTIPEDDNYVFSLTVPQEADNQTAPPEDLELDEIDHMGGEAGPDHDEATFRNTNDEHALPVGGWVVETNNQHWDGQVVIPDGTVLEPGETVTVLFPGGEKALDPSGGVLYVYDADGNLVGEFDHVGSPSAPGQSPEEATSVSLSAEVTPSPP